MSGPLAARVRGPDVGTPATKGARQAEGHPPAPDPRG